MGYNRRAHLRPTTPKPVDDEEEDEEEDGDDDDETGAGERPPTPEPEVHILHHNIGVRVGHFTQNGRDGGPLRPRPNYAHYTYTQEKSPVGPNFRSSLIPPWFGLDIHAKGPSCWPYRKPKNIWIIHYFIWRMGRASPDDSEGSENSRPVANPEAPPTLSNDSSEQRVEHNRGFEVEGSASNGLQMLSEVTIREGPLIVQPEDGRGQKRANSDLVILSPAAGGQSNDAGAPGAKRSRARGRPKGSTTARNIMRIAMQQEEEVRRRLNGPAYPVLPPRRARAPERNSTYSRSDQTLTLYETQNNQPGSQQRLARIVTNISTVSTVPDPNPNDYEMQRSIPAASATSLAWAQERMGSRHGFMANQGPTGSGEEGSGNMQQNWHLNNTIGPSGGNVLVPNYSRRSLPFVPNHRAILPATESSHSSPIQPNGSNGQPNGSQSVMDLRARYRLPNTLSIVPCAATSSAQEAQAIRPTATWVGNGNAYNGSEDQLNGHGRVGKRRSTETHNGFYGIPQRGHEPLRSNESLLRIRSPGEIPNRDPGHGFGPRPNLDQGHLNVGARQNVGWNERRRAPEAAGSINDLPSDQLFDQSHNRRNTSMSSSFDGGHLSLQDRSNGHHINGHLGGPTFPGAGGQVWNRSNLEDLQVGWNGHRRASAAAGSIPDLPSDQLHGRVRSNGGHPGLQNGSNGHHTHGHLGLPTFPGARGQVLNRLNVEDLQVGWNGRRRAPEAAGSINALASEQMLDRVQRHVRYDTRMLSNFNGGHLGQQNGTNGHQEVSTFPNVEGQLWNGLNVVHLPNSQGIPSNGRTEGPNGPFPYQSHLSRLEAMGAQYGLDQARSVDPIYEDDSSVEFLCEVRNDLSIPPRNTARAPKRRKIHHKESQEARAEEEQFDWQHVKIKQEKDLDKAEQKREMERVTQERKQEMARVRSEKQAETARIRAEKKHAREMLKAQREVEMMYKRLGKKRASKKSSSATMQQSLNNQVSEDGPSSVTGGAVGQGSHPEESRSPPPSSGPAPGRV